MKGRVLVTNDDGVASPGVFALAEAAQTAGYDVVVAAPRIQSSGSAAGLWRDPDASPVVTASRVDGFANDVLTIAAHPGLIALLAMTGQLGPIPDMVLSGINDASNLGSGVLHSGTAGAAIVAAAHGAAAAAVSLYCDDVPDEAPRHWAAAVGVVADVIDEIADSPRGAAFNINVPNAASIDRPLTQAVWSPAGCVPTLVPFIQRFHDANGTHLRDPDIIRRPGTDIALVEAGFPTVSVLRVSGAETVPWASPARQIPQPTTTDQESSWQAQWG
ncbi:5'/3'-nucleotidase SurE [Gordonia sp. TBRC 11910]|uniref:5'-nucleotidase n=1 Tax=Gordonia asplenii TaxID=2725283 RepID=A0A848L871_9ACTN|nr:5'/3'-nucleotidase SurE [Gordonia asplenii]NMO03778.1 5'/3'-nucleotidase SurE [Gordonia asplenii]